MNAPQVSVERRIAASPERVWQTLTDIEHGAQTISGIERVEMLSEGPFRVGTRWRETRRMFGKEATEEMWVTASEPPVRYVVEAESRGTHYVSEFTLTPEQGEATTVRLTFGAETGQQGGVKGALLKALGTLGSKAAARALARDLADIAASAESGERPAC